MRISDWSSDVCSSDLTATHQVATQEDLLALLDANLGVAIIPDGASATNGFRRIPLMRLELARTVSAYTVAGRPRAVACATLLNLLRAAAWRFDAGPAQQGRDHCWPNDPFDISSTTPLSTPPPP